MHTRALAVTQHLLDRLLTVYGEPQVGDINEFLREYIMQLHTFDAEELTEGCRIILATHKYRRWPFPSECIDACKMARDRIKRRAAAATNPPVATDKRCVWFLSRDHDPLQWQAWMRRMSLHDDDLKARCEAVGEIATHSNFPKEFDGVNGFVGVGPFEYDRKKEAHSTGWVTVHDADGRQIR